MDTVHTAFRNLINTAWTNLAGQQAFKNVAINSDLRAMLPDEFSTEKQIQNPMSCGESANRMCKILTGDSMSDIISNPNTVDLADETKVQSALQTILNTAGYVLVRINIVGGGAGHAYIFLSVHRAPNDPICGYIYQTNVGVHHETAYGLKQWIDDANSSALVDLTNHIEALQELGGTAPGPNRLPALVYDKTFMRAASPLIKSDSLDLNKAVAHGDRANAKFLWTPLNPSVLYRNIIKIREITESNRIRDEGTFF